MVDMLRAEGYKVSKKGKMYLMLCPFHQERTPSFAIDPRKNFAHCFGCPKSFSNTETLKEAIVDELRKAIELI
jgi:DNA primase